MAAEEIERDDEDFTYDYLYEEIGPQYAEEHGDRITREQLSSIVASAAVDAHVTCIDAAEEQMRQAHQRLAEGRWDEAVFHAGRALDGYATDVFITPFYTLALGPFQEALPHAKISETAIFGEVHGLESGAKFVYIGIAVTADKDDAMQLMGDIKALLKKPKATNPVTWEIRNSTLHSVTDPAPENAQAFVEKIAGLLARLSAPLKVLAAEADAARAEARKRSADSRAYKDFP